MPVLEFTVNHVPFDGRKTVLSALPSPSKSPLAVTRADCVTVNVQPAIVSVPVRRPPLLAATAMVTDPVPTTLPPLVTVSQLALLTAIQPQKRGVATPTLVEVVLALVLNDAAESEYEQIDGTIRAGDGGFD